jgi:hypothetical protein
MLLHRVSRGLVQLLREVREQDVSVDEFPPCFYAVVGVLKGCMSLRESLLYGRLDAPFEEVNEMIDRSGLQRLIGRCYRGSDVGGCRFQAGVRHAFACTMHAYDRLKEVHVGKFASRVSALAHDACLLKGYGDFALISRG